MQTFDCTLGFAIKAESIEDALKQRSALISVLEQQGVSITSAATGNQVVSTNKTCGCEDKIASLTALVADLHIQVGTMAAFTRPLG